jgi:hypothetical protein
MKVSPASVRPAPRRFGRPFAAGLAVAALLLVARPAAAELLVNGDFGAGNVGFSSAYNYSPGDLRAEGTYDLVTNPRNSHAYAASYGGPAGGPGPFLAFNGALAPNAVAWSQTVAVAPHMTYAFSGWLSSWSEISPATLDLLFNGKSLGAVTAPMPPGVWQKFTTTWSSGDSTSLTLALVDRNTEGLGNDFALGNLSLAEARPGPQAPEPGALTLLGIGALALLAPRLRRKRTA